jgi:hypothetical protein
VSSPAYARILPEGCLQTPPKTRLYGKVAL